MQEEINSIIGMLGNLGGHVDRNNRFHDEVGPENMKYLQRIHHEYHKNIAKHEYFLLEWLQLVEIVDVAVCRRD